MTTTRTDVLVVGAGTTGLALARLLEMQGLQVTLIDPNPIVIGYPRGSHIDDEVMRLFQTLGMSAAEPGYMVMDGVVAFDPSGREVFKWDDTPGVTEQGWVRDYQFFQPDFEASMRGMLYSSESASLLLGWRMVTAVDTLNGVEVEIVHRTTGETRMVEASYMVGADGARSKTREYLNSRTEDLGGSRSAFIVDIYRFAEIASLPSTRSMIFSGTRPVTYQPGIPPYARFNFMLTGSDDVDTLTDPGTVYKYLRPWIAPGDYRILRSDVYRYDAHLVIGWRLGRILIAGDAAHLMPPYLGQGLCSGLRDAANLAWKLARVIRGTSDDSLLDTYESERSPHVRSMIEESKRQGNLMAALSSGMQSIEQTDVVDRSRLRLVAGAICKDYAHAGSLSAQPMVNGMRLDDLVGYAFALIAHAPVLAAIPADLLTDLRNWGLQIILAGPDCEDWLAALGADAVIVRPDRYIFAAVSGPEELLEATDDLVGQLSVTTSPPSFSPDDMQAATRRSQA